MLLFKRYGDVTDNKFQIYVDKMKVEEANVFVYFIYKYITTRYGV